MGSWDLRMIRIGNFRFWILLDLDFGILGYENIWDDLDFGILDSGYCGILGFEDD